MAIVTSASTVRRLDGGDKP